jgi:hypothetical protein
MAINVRSASNIDRRIDASVPVALYPQSDSCTAAKQHGRLINLISMAISACGISTGNEPLDFQQITLRCDLASA